MAQSKAKAKAKSQKGISQKHLHSRISYLYQAATYLAKVDHQPRASAPSTNEASRKSCDPGVELQYATTSPNTTSSDTLPISPIENGNRMPENGPDIDKVSEDFSLSRQLLAHLRDVSLRSQIRLAPAVKHTVCKGCNVLLIPATTSTSYMENKSSGGRKPWADVLVTTCIACGTSKRFAVGAKRQVRRESRNDKAQNMKEQDHRAV